MKKYPKAFSIIFLTLIILFIYPPLLAGAVSWQKKSAGENELYVEGKCDEEEVTIFLYSKESGKAIFSEGVKCEDGAFSLVEDLTPWNIKDDSYDIVVGDGQNPDFSKKDELTVKQNIFEKIGNVLNNSTNELNFEIDATPSPDEQFHSAKDSFSGNVSGLSESLQRMKTSIDDTSYPEHIKTALRITIMALEELNSSLSNIFKKFDLQTAGELVDNNLPVETLKENKKDEIVESRIDDLIEASDSAGIKEE